MQQLTAAAQLAELLIGEPIGDYIARHRDDHVSWDTIARLLWADTDQRVDVSGPTIQKWANRAKRIAAETAA